MVGLLDCDNFFCSCERVFRPDLRHTPVVVLSNNDGCVVARSREVKDMGIREGMPYFELQRDFGSRGIVAFSSNYALYGDMSSRIMEVLSAEVPEVVQYSIDEAFLNLDGMDVRTLQAWGQGLCARVEQYTGMPVSLGIAPTKTLAKMASKYAKRYPAYRKCCFMATEAQRLKALQLFPVTDVWGIGHRIGRTLAAMGVNTALDFARLPRERVRSRFHVTGERTWLELNGEEAIAVDGLDTVCKKTIVTSRSFPSMLRDLDELRPHIANYAARCSLKLRRQHSAARQVSVFVQSNHFREDLDQYDAHGQYGFLTATASAVEIVDVAVRILERIFRRGILYKRAGVMVADIVPGAAVQPDLFSYSPERSEKLRRVSEALDGINSRQGADAVVLGAQQYRLCDDGGKSVKFVNAIRRDLKSPDYSTRMDALRVN